MAEVNKKWGESKKSESFSQKILSKGGNKKSQNKVFSVTSVLISRLN